MVGMLAERVLETPKTESVEIASARRQPDRRSHQIAHAAANQSAKRISSSLRPMNSCAKRSAGNNERLRAASAPPNASTGTKTFSEKLFVRQPCGRGRQQICDAEESAAFPPSPTSRANKTSGIAALAIARTCIGSRPHSPIREPVVPVVSNLTGEVAEAGRLCSPEYWVEHVRGTVRFHDGVQALRELKVSTFLELGPDGVLSGMVAQDCVPSLRRDVPEDRALMSSLGQLHARGVEVDWEKVFAGNGARRVDLPTYAFQHQRFWLAATASDD